MRAHGQMHPLTARLLLSQGMLVVPELLAGLTDSAQWSKHHPGVPILRFVPCPINRTAGDVGRIHGVDERVGTDAYLAGIRFYVQYMRTTL